MALIPAMSYILAARILIMCPICAVHLSMALTPALTCLHGPHVPFLSLLSLGSCQNHLKPASHAFIPCLSPAVLLTLTPFTALKPLLSQTLGALIIFFYGLL